MWRFLHPTTKKRDGEINSFFHARLKSSGDAEEIFLKTVEITRIFNSFGLLCTVFSSLSSMYLNPGC